MAEDNWLLAAFLNHLSQHGLEVRLSEDDSTVRRNGDLVAIVTIDGATLTIANRQFELAMEGEEKRAVDFVLTLAGI